MRRNETLADIARQYNVPLQLLQKINGIENPNVLLPGSELKVLHGPFRGDVDLQAQELTVFLNQLYAGRFPITVGRDPEPIAGEFQVRDKQLEKAYFSMDGRTIPAESPANPFGHVWLDLGREVCIHGSPMGGASSNVVASASARAMRRTCTVSCRSGQRFVFFADRRSPLFSSPCCEPSRYLPTRASSAALLGVVKPCGDGACRSSDCPGSVGSHQKLVACDLHFALSDDYIGNRKIAYRRADPMDSLGS